MASAFNNRNGNNSPVVSHPLSHGLTLADICINSGQVKEDEIPLWVGASHIKDESKPKAADMTASISLARDWFWVRTVAKPHPQHIDWFRKRGFVYSGQRNGWHVDVNEKNAFIVNSIIRDGYKFDVPAILQASVESKQEWEKQQEAAREAKRDKEYKQSLSTGRTTVDHAATRQAQAEMQQAAQAMVSTAEYKLGLRRNKAGRLMDKDGKFVSKEKYQELMGTLPPSNPVNLPAIEEPQPSGFVGHGEALAMPVVEATKQDDSTPYDVALTITGILSSEAFAALDSAVIEARFGRRVTQDEYDDMSMKQMTALYAHVPVKPVKVDEVANMRDEIKAWLEMGQALLAKLA